MYHKIKYMMKSHLKLKHIEKYKRTFKLIMYAYIMETKVINFFNCKLFMKLFK